jgi:GAF domain-containing protein/HAMP domain-containing protein
MPFRLKTIRARLFQLLIIAMGSLVLAVVLVWQLSIEPTLRLSVAKAQSEVAKRAAEQIGSFIDARIRELQATAEIGRFWEEETDRHKHAIHQLFKLAPQIQEVSLIAPDGHEQLRLSRLRTITDDDLRLLHQLEVFQKALRGQTSIGFVYHTSTAEPYLSIAVPVKFTAADIRGVLKAEISLKSLWETVSHIQVGQTGHLYVVNQKGELIAHPDYSKVLLGLNLAHVEEVQEFIEDPTQDTEFAEVETGEAGQPALTCFAVIPQTGWAVIVEESVESALADARKLKLLAGAILFMAVGGAFFVSYRFSRRVSDPVRDLERGAELIARGDLDHRLDIRTGDEIESLAAKFNGMAQSLKESYESLEGKIAERTREISSLYAALAPLSPANSLSEVLKGVIDRLVDSTEADAALIRLRHPRTGFFFCPAATGFDEAYLDATRMIDRGSAINRVVTQGRPVIAPDILADERIQKKRQMASGFVSCAFLPLKVAGEVRGVIHLASRTRGFFDSDKEARLMAMARQMSIAIENHELFAQTQRRQQELQALYTITETVTRSLDPNVLTQSALMTTIDVLKLSAGRLYVFDQEDRLLRLTAHHGVPVERLEEIRSCAPGTGAIGAVFGEKEPLIFPTVRDDPVFSAAVPGQTAFKEQNLASVGLPIMIKDRVVGVIQLYGSRVREFDSQDMEILSAIGRQIGVAIENARLFQETVERARQQEALNAIAAATTRSLDLEELFEIALDKVLEVTGRERVSIRLRDAATGAVSLSAYRGFANEEVDALRRMTQHRMSEQVFSLGEPVVVNESARDGDSRSLLPNSSSVAWVPMKARGSVVGVLGVSATRPNPFSRREVEFLLAVGNVIGVALENARLFQETQRSLKRIRGLHEIDKAIASSLELNIVLNVLLEQIESFLPCPASSTIRLFDRDSGLLEPVACRNLDIEAWRAWKGGRGTSSIVYQTKAPVMIPNVQCDPRTQDVEFFVEHNLVSYLGVPLIVKEEALGVLGFYTSEERPFSREEVEFLVTLGGQAAIAIHNSQLYGQVRKQAVELEQSNKVKDEFLSVMSHELRTPLIAIMGYAGLMEDGMMGENSPDQAKAIGVIKKESDHLLAMIREILDATRLESGAAIADKQPADLAKLLAEIEDTYRLPLGKPVALRWRYDSSLPIACTDVTKLKQILQNLISNAIKFTETGSITISARRSIEEEAVYFEVADTGIGIPSEMLPLIFDKFRQVDSSDTRSYDGVGLGLFIAKKFAELLGGSIAVRSDPGRGSTFTVTLPCAAIAASGKRLDDCVNL